MKQLAKLLSIVLFIAFIAASCEKDIVIDIPITEQKIVVEGSIENGQPPFVFLTKTNNFYGAFDFNNLDELYVHGAEVYVTPSTGARTQLVEICLSFINDSVGAQTTLELINGFGFNVAFDEVFEIDTMPINTTDTVYDTLYTFADLCLYTLPEVYDFFLTGNITFVSILGTPNTSYDLEVFAEGKVLTATTSITEILPIDSLSYRYSPDLDSFATVYLHVTVPDETDRFIRYATKRNDEGFIKPEITGSVFDNGLFSGSGSIELPVERGYPRGVDPELEEFGLFRRGDSVTVEWQNIDRGTYEFWFTIENDGGDTPFSSPVQIKSNINGGLGIWAGYGSTYTTIFIP